MFHLFRFILRLSFFLFNEREGFNDRADASELEFKSIPWIFYVRLRARGKKFLDLDTGKSRFVFQSEKSASFPAGNNCLMAYGSTDIRYKVRSMGKLPPRKTGSQFPPFFFFVVPGVSHVPRRIESLDCSPTENFLPTFVRCGFQRFEDRLKMNIIVVSTRERNYSSGKRLCFAKKIR